MIRKVISVIYRHYRFDVITILSFLYYNFFCKNVERRNGALLVIQRNSSVVLNPQSKIILYGDLLFSTPVKKDKYGSLLILKKNGVLIINKQWTVGHSSEIEIQENGHLEIDRFLSNCHLQISCGSHIRIRGFVSCGRYVTIKDFNGHKTNIPGWEISSPITIEDNTMICGGVTILPGVKISKNSIIGDGAIIRENTEESSYVIGNPSSVCYNNVKHQY